MAGIKSTPWDVGENILVLGAGINWITVDMYDTFAWIEENGYN